MHLQDESYPAASFPERVTDLPVPERMPQAFGFLPGLVGGALLVGALLCLVKGESPRLGERLALALSLGLPGGLFLWRELWRRKHRTMLALRPEGLAVYEDGARTAVHALSAVQVYALAGDTTLHWMVLPLAVGGGMGVAAVQVAGTGGFAAFVGAGVALAAAASILHMRMRCRHFLIPTTGLLPAAGKPRHIALSPAHGAALLAAVPRTGNWRVTE